MADVEDSLDSGTRPRWLLVLLAIALPCALLASVDLGLRALSIVPPEDPLLFYARSHARGFSPLVTNADGSLSIGRGGEPRSPRSIR